MNKVKEMKSERRQLEDAFRKLGHKAKSSFRKKHDKNGKEEIIEGSMLEFYSMNFQAERISITTDKNFAKAHYHEM